MVFLGGKSGSCSSRLGFRVKGLRLTINVPYNEGSYGYMRGAALGDLLALQV